MIYKFFVTGLPKPGGSKKAFIHKHTGKIIVTDTCNNKNWRTLVATAALNAKIPTLLKPLCVHFVFYLPRPKSHYGKGKRISDVRKSSPKYPAVKPDATKLVRSTEDALTGIIWKDDAQIINQIVIKKYADFDHPGCEISIEEIE